MGGMRERAILVIVSSIAAVGTSAVAQESEAPVRQSVYSNSGVAGPAYPAGVYQAYPQYPAYPTYPAPTYPGYPQYPGYAGYPQYPGYAGYPQQPMTAAPGIAGQSVMRDPATGQVLAAPGAVVRPDNVEIDPAVMLRGQTPTQRGPQPPPGSGLGGQGLAREKLLGRTARSAGIKAGYAQEAARINNSLNDLASALDAKYPFPSLMVGDYVVPPVVILTGDRVEKNGPRVLELSLGRFEIVSPARVTAQPPTWRNYLFMQADDGGDVGVQPRTSDDKRAWSSGYSQGVAMGVREARAGFAEAQRRMRRDYEGMLRFHDLARSGAVSLPASVVNGKALRVSNNGRVALIGMKSITLTVTPRFKPGAPVSAYIPPAKDVTVRSAPPKVVAAPVTAPPAIDRELSRFPIAPTLAAERSK